jgi:glutaredoxin
MEGSTEKVVEGSTRILSYLSDAYTVAPDSTETASSDDELEDAKDQVIKALAGVGLYISTLLRFRRGQLVVSAASATSTIPVPRPEKPLVLYSYEGNQFCRLVREVLMELDIVYELRSAGKQSPRREELAEITGGSSQCPYLIDPNTGVSMFESADIIKYLYNTYALWTPPSEILAAASAVVSPLLKPVYKKLAPVQVGSYNEDKLLYKDEIAKAKAEIEKEVSSDTVVVYTYSLSPFCTEATKLLDSLGVTYKEISLGSEWIPGLISEPAKRAALGEMTGQTSLPHVFIGGESIGGLFSGAPGLVPSLEEGALLTKIETAKNLPSAIDAQVS